MWARDMWPMIDKLGAVREFPSLLLSIWPVKRKYALPVRSLLHFLFVWGVLSHRAASLTAVFNQINAPSEQLPSRRCP